MSASTAHQHPTCTAQHRPRGRRPARPAAGRPGDPPPQRFDIARARAENAARDRYRQRKLARARGTLAAAAALERQRRAAARTQQATLRRQVDGLLAAGVGVSDILDAAGGTTTVTRLAAAYTLQELLNAQAHQEGTGAAAARKAQRASAYATQKTAALEIARERERVDGARRLAARGYTTPDIIDILGGVQDRERTAVAAAIRRTAAA